MNLPAAVIALAAALFGSAASARDTAADRFMTGGVPVTIERYGAAVSESRPAVLLLPGSDGATEPYRVAARRLAASRLSVFLLRYLDRTGETRADLSAVGRHLPLWTETVRDAVSHVSRQAGVDPNRIGLL